MLAVALIALSGCGGSGGRVTTSMHVAHPVAAHDPGRSKPVVRPEETLPCMDTYGPCGIEETTIRRVRR